MLLCLFHKTEQFCDPDLIQRIWWPRSRDARWMSPAAVYWSAPSTSENASVVCSETLPNSTLRVMISEKQKDILQFEKTQMLDWSILYLFTHTTLSVGLCTFRKWWNCGYAFRRCRRLSAACRLSLYCSYASHMMSSRGWYTAPTDSCGSGIGAPFPCSWFKWHSDIAANWQSKEKTQHGCIDLSQGLQWTQVWANCFIWLEEVHPNRLPPSQCFGTVFDDQWWRWHHVWEDVNTAAHQATWPPRMSPHSRLVPPPLASSSVPSTTNSEKSGNSLDETHGGGRNSYRMYFAQKCDTVSSVLFDWKLYSSASDGYKTLTGHWTSWRNTCFAPHLQAVVRNVWKRCDTLERVTVGDGEVVCRAILRVCTGFWPDWAPAAFVWPFPLVLTLRETAVVQVFLNGRQNSFHRQESSN